MREDAWEATFFSSGAIGAVQYRSIRCNCDIAYNQWKEAAIEYPAPGSYRTGLFAARSLVEIVNDAPVSGSTKCAPRHCDNPWRRTDGTESART